MRPGEHRRRDPTPNDALRSLLAETRWTQESFARAIAKVAAEAGVRLGYDRTSVARWLRGSRPSPRVQSFIAEALSRRLGRPVDVTQLGMGDGQSGGPGRRTARRDARARGADGGARPEFPCAGAEFEERARRRPLPADQLAALTAAVVGPPRADPPPPAPYRLTLTLPTYSAEGACSTAGAHPERSTPARAPGVGEPGPDTTDLGATDLDEPGAGDPGTGARDGGSRGTGDPSVREPRVREPGVGDDPTETAEPLRPRPPRAHFPSLPRGGRPVRRTTPDEVASVREHARFFAQQADRHGGGHIRTPLAACLAGLVRRLRTGGEGPHHPRLVAGAARLSYLLARVYADEQRHGLAQRAFDTAAQLAAEGGDPEGVALVHRALSSQAHQLGHRRLSLALAESACEAAPAGAAPSTRSFLYAGLAVARAADGERGRALAALRRAEHELARAPADLTTGPESPDGGEPVGSYQDAALHYQAGQVRAALGDRDGAVRELRASLRSRPAGERRSRALSEAELAELLLADGRLEEACAAWQGFLEDSALVRSGRARRARDRMPRLLAPYAHERCVQGLLTRTGLLPNAAATE
jgi:transcriptional regulator with XRE-family HTH domain/tetratricopeptide (TPR) repeat protein